MPVLFKAVRPKNLPSIPRFRGLILQAERKTQELVIEDMKKTTATWEHPVEFYGKVSYKAGNTYVAVDTPDKVWHYLDKGTAERWAIMSNPFVPKTSPGWLGSRPGKGFAVVRGRSHMQHDMGPIKARHWSEYIEAHRLNDYVKMVNEAVTRTFRKP